MPSIDLPSFVIIFTSILLIIPSIHSAAVPRSPSLSIPRLFKRSPTCVDNYGGISAEDCQAAANQITNGQNFNDNFQRHFYTTSSYYVFDPSTFYGSVDISGSGMSWSSGECKIGLWMPEPRNYETATWQNVKDAAQDLIDTCVAPGRQGGRNGVGDLGPYLEVIIFQESEDDEDTVDTDPSQGTCPLQKAEARQDVTDCFLGGIAVGSGGRK